MTLWLLGLSMLLLGLGGIATDLWRVQVVHADLAALADSAATAAAGHIDTAAFRRDGSIVLDLDPATGAEAAAWAVLGAVRSPAFSQTPEVVVTANRVEVRVTARMRFGLLAVFLPRDAETLEVAVTGTAAPRESGG